MPPRKKKPLDPDHPQRKPGQQRKPRKPGPPKPRKKTKRYTETEGVSLFGKVEPAAPIALSLDRIRQLAGARNPLALCSHASEEELVEALFVAASDPKHESWDAVLSAARVPWLAWLAMRKGMPEAAALLHKTWASRMADAVAFESLAIADTADAVIVASREDGSASALPQVRAALEFQAINHAKLRLVPRLWLAERLDPEVYAKRSVTAVTGGTTDVRRVEIVLVDEIANPL